MTESYKFRPNAEPYKHSVYKAYLSALGLETRHFSNLIKRGLNSEQINNAQYVSKPSNNSKTAQNALGIIENQFKLKGIAGFYIDPKTKHRSQSGVSGTMIPVRDCNGKINSLICRVDKPNKDKWGNIKGKYLAFSSNGKPEGEKVWQTTHCPIVTGTARKVSSTTVRITEGILKADIATALGDFYCLGMHGLNPSKDLGNVLEELEISTIIVCLDAGEDENSDILLSKKKLFKLADDIGIDVYFETWDPQYGKGIDDVFVNGHADKIRRLSAEEVKGLIKEADSKDPTSEDLFYVISIQQFMNKTTRQILSKSQYADKYEMGSASSVNSFLTDCFEQKVDGLTFMPNGAEVITECGLKKFNEWRDPKIRPVEGDVSLFTQHMELLLAEEKDRDLFLDWLAYCVQHPGKKVMWALVLIGSEGIGKSFLGFILRNCLGIDNISFPTNEQIQEPYTDWQRGCQLVIIEELMTMGRKDLINKLKPIITQPITKIREMYTTPYDYPNRFNILAFTNYDDALLIGEGDRRYGVFKSEMKPQGEAYYETLWNWAKQPDSIQSLLYYFMNRNIRNFNPHARAPVTGAKRFMIEVSRSALEDWICGCIGDNCWPFNRQIVSIRHLKSKDICPQHLQKYSNQKWACALKKAGAVHYDRQVPLSDKSRLKVWFIGDKKDILINLPPAELATQYEKEELQAKKDKDNVTNPLVETKPF